LSNRSLIGGYTIVSPPATFISIGSKEEACSAEEFLLNYDWEADPPNNPILVIQEAQGLIIQLGTILFDDWHSTDCSLIPDGWYFTDELMYAQQVFHVVSGIIIEIASCIPPTTTTTTTCFACPTTTSTTTLPQIDCGNTIIYDSDTMYENAYTVNLGSATGTVILFFEAENLPDRYIVLWNASQVIDTGYHGSSDYDFGGINRDAFNNGLVGKIDPVTLNTYPDAGTYPDDGYPRVASPSSGIESFSKSAASPGTATLSIYSAFNNSTGEFILGCPGVTTTTTTTSTPSTTTTTTTTFSAIYQYRVSNNIYPTKSAACSSISAILYSVYSNKLPGAMFGSYLYNDVALTSICTLTDGIHLLKDASLNLYIVITSLSVVIYEEAC